MQHSESIKELATALAKVQAIIEGAAKDKDNPAFRGSKYADLSAVWEAWQKCGPDNGLSVVQMPGMFDPVGKTMEMDVMLMHSSGDWLGGKMSVPLGKVDVQGYGSCVTYSRRYSLAAIAGICPEDDDGNAAVRRPVNDANHSDQSAEAEPAPREKLEGPFASKSTLQAGMRAFVNKLLAAQSVAEIEALETENAAELAQCERYLPIWWNGDGADKRGVKGQIADAKAALVGADEGMFGALVRSMKECETTKSLTAWMATNETLIDGLNDIDRRRFEKERDQFESGLSAVARRNAG